MIVIFNNMVIDNVLVYEGGGLVFDDVVFVDVVNNMVVCNFIIVMVIISDG